MMLATFMCALLSDGAAETYSVDHLALPSGAILEVGGMDWLDGDRLVVSTRRGQVWIVDHALDPDPTAARFHLFCEGLQEGLGLKVVDGKIYVLQRAELSRLSDFDGDLVCDAVETVSNRFGVSGNYHEFAFGLPTDAQGNFFVALNLGFTEPKWWHGRSLSAYRGWVLKIAPDGTTTPFASGFRSPCGIGTNAVGDLFVTDNQGDWMPACPLEHVKPGAFYGAPASLVWTDAYQTTRAEPSLTVPVDAVRTPPACWIPYKWSRSTGDMRAIPRDGSFGPFEDQLVLAELTNGMILRADLEKVRGEYQGAVWPLREDVGSAIRGLFARDGTLFLGLTNRGWGGRAPGHGIARVKWNKLAPFEVKHARLRQDGFELEFTEPLASTDITGDDIDVSLYHYDWWWEYGSPERDDGKRVVTKVEVASDRRSLVFQAPLEAGHMARVTLKNVKSAGGRSIAHPEFAYAINQLPEGELCTTPIARVVPPPPGRVTKEEGWLRLTYGDALDVWREKDGWKLVDIELDAKDPTRFVTRKGYSALVNTAEGETRLVSTPVFGDGQFRFGVTLASRASATVYVAGRYGIRISDASEWKSGAIVGAEGSPDLAPKAEFQVVPDNGHQILVDFRAPKFDASGKKIANAKFNEVRIDGVLVQENVELTSPSLGALGAEVASGPLMLVAAPLNVAFADVRAKPAPLVRTGVWKTLFEDDGLDGWRSTGREQWKREDGVLASQSGPTRIVSERVVPVNFRMHAKAKIGSGGLAWLVLRAPSTPEAGEGISILLNADHPLRSRTGSMHSATRAEFFGLDSALPELAPRFVGLVGADTWFDIEVEVRDAADAKSAQVDVFMNGVLVNSASVPHSDAFGSSIAIENHHAGSVLEISTLEIQELSPLESDRSSPLPK